MRTALVYLLALSALAAPATEAPATTALEEPVVEASWYGDFHHGRVTANGETFDMYGLTAAHKDLPFGSRVRVIDVETGRSVVVRINDRGPYLGDRAIDLSYGAARELGMVREGVAHVRLEPLPDDGAYPPAAQLGD